ncbi:MAG: T9SS type A sorting domain-containing protein [Chitinophagaceae bacterium]|nr:T9SS type A sorting domain-containing protein [Chitinophagaceae bacterium]
MKRNKHILSVLFCLSFSVFSLNSFSQANVLVGKSFINITRPGGGTIIPGDELEIRISVYVTNNGTGVANRTIYRTRFNDTIPSSLNYVTGSLKLLTNEAVLYRAYTDASGDDFAMYDAVTRTIRFNLGRDTILAPTNMPVRNVVSTLTDTTLNGGGYFRSDTHRPRASGGMLILVTYRVTVPVATPYNTIINYGPGTLRYRNQVSAIGATDFAVSPNALSFIIYNNYGLCVNATGSNSVNAGSGDFGSGTTHNGTNPGTVPDYNFVSLTTGNPGDGNYSVIKNVSPSQSTNQFIQRPESASLNRVFGVWDIIGDHTNAADPNAGNPPSASGSNGGYMLAVNAAYRLGVANNQNISGLCEDTYYEFSAWFRNICKRCGIDSMGRGASGVSVPAGYLELPVNDSSGVKPNLTFQINGVDYYNSGNLDYVGTWGQWVKKGFVFRTAPGQTSLTISIKNNAPGGGGNDWAMDDISFASCLPGLDMKPGPSPSYCQNAQVSLSAIVSTYYNNYLYYQWERSTDGGTTWSAAPEFPAVQTFTYVFDGINYKDTVAMPDFLATTANNGYQYRIKVATSLINLATNTCSIYQGNTIAITVLSSCDVLNVDLLQFNGEVLNQHSKLSWTAKSESSHPHSFEIERSDDGIHFKTIGAVQGNVNSGTYTYNFTDPDILNGKKHYRLKIISVNGNAAAKISQTITLHKGSVATLSVHSIVNPFDDKLKFQINAPETELIQIRLLDMYGKLITTLPLTVKKGNNPVTIETLGYLSKGTYILSIQSNRVTINKTLQRR